LLLAAFLLAPRADPGYAQIASRFCRRFIMHFFLAGLICSCSVAGPDEAVAAKFQAWWSDLGSLDGAKAYRAMWNFVEKPAATIPFLEKQLAPVQPADPKLLASLLKDLRSENFKARARASLALEKLDLLAKDALIQASKENQPLESRRRIEQLLQKLAGPKSDPDSLRAVRAVEILEMIGGEEAKLLSRKWAGGAPAAFLTQEARDTLGRLARRPPYPLIKAGKGEDVDGDPLPAGASARLGTTRFRIPRYPGVALDVVFTPDQKQVALLQGENLYVMDAASGKLVRRFKNPYFYRLAFSPDGKLLVSAFGQLGDLRHSIRAWPSGEEVGGIGYADHGSARSLVFTGPKTLLTADSDSAIRQWDLVTMKETLRKAFFKKGLDRIQFSPDGNLLAATEDSMNLYLWEWNTDKPPRQIKSNGIHIDWLVFSPDGKTLATTHSDSLIRLWGVSTGRLSHALHSPNKKNFSTLAFSPDGKTLATNTYQSSEVFLWNVDTGKRNKTLSGLDHAGRLVFSADGKQLAGANAHGLQLWDLATGMPQRKDIGHLSDIGELAFSPTGGVIASAGHDGTARLWEARTGKQLHVLRHEADWVRALAFAPDGSRLASLGYDDAVRLWEIETGKQIFKLAGHGRVGDGRRPLAFTSDGRQLLSWGDDFYLRAFDTKTGKAVIEHRILPEGEKLDGASDLQSQAINTRGFILRDQRLFGMSNPNGSFTLFDLRTGKEKSRLLREGIIQLGSVHAVSPSERFLLIEPHEIDESGDAREDYQMEIWHLPSGKRVRTVSGKGHSRHVAWAPDSRSFAVAHDGMITVWEMATARVRLNLGNLGAAASTVAFSPDGRLLVVGLRDTTALVMDLATLSAGPQGRP
jgi:WD40 repeat protein